MLRAEEQARVSVLENPANFGETFDRHCICVQPGQVLCPGYKELPKSMQGKWRSRLHHEEISPEELQEMDKKLAKWVKNK